MPYESRSSFFDVHQRRAGAGALGYSRPRSEKLEPLAAAQSAPEGTFRLSRMAQSTLPLVTSAKHQEASRPNSPSRIEGPTIAVVDDDSAVCDSIRALLEAHGAYVRTYQGGIALLQASPNVDCLILDYDMPGLNGLDVISELRTREWTTPTVLITAIDHPSIEQQALQLGIQLIKKSSGPQALLQAIRAKLEQALCPRNI
jgi:CheY-like chemotaxis protein